MGIMTYKAKPNHDRCVSLVTKAALREMIFPGLICVITPVTVGVIFRFVGEASTRPLLGAQVLASYLMFGTVTGILMALFLDTTGGAWDNAKKFVELGNFGGKGSEAHKAAITGDTVGDPFKDTAGPSLHVVISCFPPPSSSRGRSSSRTWTRPPCKWFPERRELWASPSDASSFAFARVLRKLRPNWNNGVGLDDYNFLRNGKEE